MQLYKKYIYKAKEFCNSTDDNSVDDAKICFLKSLKECANPYEKREVLIHISYQAAFKNENWVKQILVDLIDEFQTTRDYIYLANIASRKDGINDQTLSLKIYHLAEENASEWYDFLDIAMGFMALDKISEPDWEFSLLQKAMTISTTSHQLLEVAEGILQSNNHKGLLYESLYKALNLAASDRELNEILEELCYISSKSDTYCFENIKADVKLKMDQLINK